MIKRSVRTDAGKKKEEGVVKVQRQVTGSRPFIGTREKGRGGTAVR